MHVEMTKFCLLICGAMGGFILGFGACCYFILQGWVTVNEEFLDENQKETL